MQAGPTIPVLDLMAFNTSGCGPSRSLDPDPQLWIDGTCGCTNTDCSDVLVIQKLPLPVRLAAERDRPVTYQAWQCKAITSRIHCTH